jgi:hypothetical protein
LFLVRAVIKPKRKESIENISFNLAPKLDTQPYRMSNILDKPSPETKALSLFLMAYKTTSPNYKEKYKHIKKQWGKVISNDLSSRDYVQEVQDTLASYGGYASVVEQTVKFYIDKTGEWTLQGDDKYCIDAMKVANEILNKNSSE